MHKSTLYTHTCNRTQLWLNVPQWHTAQCGTFWKCGSRASLAQRPEGFAVWRDFACLLDFELQQLERFVGNAYRGIDFQVLWSHECSVALNLQHFQHFQISTSPKGDFRTDNHCVDMHAFSPHPMFFVSITAFFCGLVIWSVASDMC